MKITFTPVRDERQLSLSVSGMSLVVNGQTFDLSALQEGDILPAEAVASEFVVGSVSIEDGELCVTVRLPHGKNAPLAARFPEPVTIADGPVNLPPFDTDDKGRPIAHAPDIGSGAGAVDLDQRSTAQDREDEALDAWRESAVLSRTEFATACVRAQLITMTEARAWLGGGILPAVAQSAIDAIPDDDQADAAELTFVGAGVIERMNPLLGLIQAQLGLADADLDTLFGWREAGSS